MTKIIRVPINEATTEHLLDVCDNHWAAGYRLASTVATGRDLILIFQPKE